MYAKDLYRKVKSVKRQRALNGLFISDQTPYGYIMIQVLVDLFNLIQLITQILKVSMGLIYTATV